MDRSLYVGKGCQVSGHFASRTEGDRDQHRNQLSQDTLVPRQSSVSSEGSSVKNVVSFAADSQEPSEHLMLHCTQCGHELSGDEWFCMECGSFQSEPGTPVTQPIGATGLATDSHRLAEDLSVSCTQCGHKLPEDAWLCPECGSFQDEPAPTVESSYFATASAETPPSQPITVATPRTDLARRGPSRITSGWQWLVSVVSGSLTIVD